MALLAIWPSAFGVGTAAYTNVGGMNLVFDIGDMLVENVFGARRVAVYNRKVGGAMLGSVRELLLRERRMVSSVRL